MMNKENLITMLKANGITKEDFEEDRIVSVYIAGPTIFAGSHEGYNRLKEIRIKAQGREIVESELPHFILCAPKEYGNVFEPYAKTQEDWDEFLGLLEEQYND
jgi:hypothetical protein